MDDCIGRRDSFSIVTREVDATATLLQRQPHRADQVGTRAALAELCPARRLGAGRRRPPRRSHPLGGGGGAGRRVGERSGSRRGPAAHAQRLTREPTVRRCPSLPAASGSRSIIRARSCWISRATLAVAGTAWPTSRSSGRAGRVRPGSPLTRPSRGRLRGRRRRNFGLHPHPALRPCVAGRGRPRPPRPGAVICGVTEDHRRRMSRNSAGSAAGLARQHDQPRLDRMHRVSVRSAGGGDRPCPRRRPTATVGSIPDSQEHWRRG